MGQRTAPLRQPLLKSRLSRLALGLCRPIGLSSRRTARFHETGFPLITRRSREQASAREAPIRFRPQTGW